MQSSSQTAHAAQQAAIQEAQARYEHGELSFETFKRALDALVLARDADECQVILQALPISPLAPLNSLDIPNTTNIAAPAAMSGLPHKRIVAFMGLTKKMRRSWDLQPNTQAMAFMGNIMLDLGKAVLPPRAKLQVTAIMSAMTIYVPRGMRVAVRSTVLLGDTHALGESTSGVVAFGHEEHVPTDAPPEAELEIESFILMGNVQIVLTDGPIVSIGELVRDALRVVREGVQRGLQQGAGQRASLGAGSEHSAGQARLETPRSSS